MYGECANIFVCLFISLGGNGSKCRVFDTRSVNEWLMHISYPECGMHACAWTYDVTAGVAVHVRTMLLQKTAVLRHLYAFVNFSK